MDPALAQKFLDAHEQDPDEPKREKDMDLANNSSGLKASAKLKGLKKFSKDNLLNQFKNDLESNRLIVIRPKTPSVKKGARK